MEKCNDRIKLIRKELGLSQKDFGERINISRGHIAGYETGKSNIPERTIRDICREFNVSEEWLRTGEGEMYQPEPEIDELAYLMGKFSINANEDETRTKIIKALLKLDDTGWKVIEGLVDDILEDVKK